jgi:hypothetical protein
MLTKDAGKLVKRSASRRALSGAVRGVLSGITAQGEPLMQPYRATPGCADDHRSPA